MVEWKKLGEIANITIGEFVHRDKQNPKAKYPVYNGGTTYTGFYEYYNNTGNKIVISARGYAGFVNRVFDNYWAGNSSYSIDINNSKVLWHYVYYYLKNEQYNIMSMQQKGGGLAAISKKQVQELLIPIPSLSEQSRIVSILDTFTSSISNLKQQIEERRKQYEYERDLLLDLEGKEGVEMKKLGEICDTLSGFPFDSSQFSETGIRLMRGMNVKRGYFDFSKENNKYWLCSEGLEKYLLESNDIIISMDGSLVGRSFCYLTKEHLPLLLVQRVARIRTKENSKYIYFYISQKFPDYVDKKKTAGAIPHISMKDINSFVIPLPSKTTQSRIVSILDTFEQSISNLEEQLAMREKQYEYYRNQLLTFEGEEERGKT